MRATGFTALPLAVFALATAPASGRTWRVPPDATTIPAAMDSAAGGDSIVVAPGVYRFRMLSVTNGVVLTSQAGPLETEVSPDPGGFSADPLFCSSLPGARAWAISALSPCAAAQSGSCGRIGATDPLCSPVPAENRSWGRVKSRFGTRSISAPKDTRP